MNEEDRSTQSKEEGTVPFYERPSVHKEEIHVGEWNVPMGVERVSHPNIGISGAYGTWGECYDNNTLMGLVEKRCGEPLADEERLALSPLGFTGRHHVEDLSQEEHLELEVEVGARFLREAAEASGWEPTEVEGVLIGMTAPVSDDYVERIAATAGIPDKALKVSIHKACDSSVGGLHLALNPELAANKLLDRNIAEELFGKKILVGGIEGLSRFVKWSNDKLALQLFGNGAGVIGVIPGKTMRFLVGKAHELFDEKGLLAVSMYYPHSGRREEGLSNTEISRAGTNHYRVAGLMHEPEDGSPVAMAGPMGMVKLFVRTGVKVVRDVCWDYQTMMDELGMSGKRIMVSVVHHANLKINSLKQKHLGKEGIHLSMPWVLSDFGNVSAASNMIAFLRQLSYLEPGDHIMFDGFGAGTYYDTFAVAL
jgi:3-oxoacyl-[acyl-carrier-protein] synthase III